ncbi:DNA-directed RNA polymerase I subunit RPA43 [Halotydeus destructor]|nr:DNA-directed RNA polymerase I subunit RPA43 [Halotydeus destructor]
MAAFKSEARELKYGEALECVKLLFHDPKSCIKKVKKLIELPLAPSSIGNEEGAVIAILNSWCSQYNQELNGILLVYDNVGFASKYGRIKDDLPYVFWDVWADFFMCEPQVGEVMKGEVSRFGKSKFVSCVICNCISATVHVPEVLSDGLSRHLMTGEQIYFRVTAIDFSTCSIKGEIDEECEKLISKLRPITPATPDSTRKGKSNPTNFDDF